MMIVSHHRLQMISFRSHKIPCIVTHTHTHIGTAETTKTA